MPTDLNPGPPLLAEDEFCPCQPPGAAQYLKAAAAAVAAALAGGPLWVAASLSTRELRGFPLILIGLGAGWLIHMAAGRLRSVWLGALAVVATLGAAATGYALLWLPLLDPRLIDRNLSWYHLAMAGLAAFVAYRMSGPAARTAARF